MPSQAKWRATPTRVEKIRTITKKNSDTNLTKNPFSVAGSNSEREISRNIRYDPTDKGPFCVFADRAGEIINITKFGELVVSLNYKSIESIVQVNKKKIKIQTTDFATANRLLNDNRFSNLGYELFVPKSFLTSTGVISNVPADVNIEYIKEKIKCVGRYQNTKIFNVERMLRWNAELKATEPCDKLIVTFRSQKLPEGYFFRAS